MKKTAQGGMLVAVALVLSLIERLFPLQALIPIPGIRLGLANVVTLFALSTLGFFPASAVLFCRAALSSFFFGSVTGFLFSVLGGLCALVAMHFALLRRDDWFSLVGVSIAGAAAHNIGQIAASIITLGTTDVVGYLPVLLLSAIPMGFVTGLTGSAVLTHLKKIHF